MMDEGEVVNYLAMILSFIKVSSADLCLLLDKRSISALFH